MKALVVVPDYPNKDKISYQFVHDRVKEYNKNFEVEVFCYNKNFTDSYVFESVKVDGGDKNKLLEKIKNNKYDVFLFHFFNGKNARFILKNLKKEKVFIWFHGSDSVSYKRRLARINYEPKKLINPIYFLKVLAFIFFNKLRFYYIKTINKKLSNITFVFVSKWNKLASEKDIKIKYKNYNIIHNYVNSNSFPYRKKTENDRLKVLSINNYSNNIYAGDMTQEIILEFSKHEEFKNFEFSLYGFGALFDEYTKNLKSFSNVKIHKGHLTHEEIKKEQDKHGIFLYPKRGDSQGVSRCEAMSSGLVPIASDIEAISEFSPENTCYLVKTVDDFVESLKDIYYNPQNYLLKSKEASKFIKEKCSYENTIKKEIDMIKGVLE